jgi:hypothetical protein
MNVGELKKLIENLSDDIEIVTITNNYEMGRSLVKARGKIGKYKQEDRYFRDDFDGTRYTAKVYIQDDNEGKDTLVIFG